MDYLRIILLLLGLSFYKTDAVTSEQGRFQADKNKVCMRDIGCFELTDDYNGRAINLLPQDRRLINTQFFLYTRNNPNEKHLLISNKPKTLIHSPLDTTLPTKFIVHGFLDNQLFAKWQVEMKDELMKKDEYNIIIVDWSGGNQLPYSQAAANTRVVGAEIAFLINQLQKYLGLNIKTCHIIGHSLGAHVAGYAGERLNKLHRITAMDPAEPYFQDFPPSVRIDPTDAEFVDAIHTDSDSILVLGFGMRQLVGHLDFFPNDGRKQPGCEADKRIWSLITEGMDGVRKFASCSHQRAVDFFKASINLKNCKPIGHRCSNWTEFINGNCVGCGPGGSECAIMGLDADQFQVKDQNASIEIFLKTQENAPFCAYHYRVTVRFSTNDDESVKGKISLGVSDEFGKKITVDLNEKYCDFTPGGNLIFVIAVPIEIDLKRSIAFKWRSDSIFSFISSKINVEDIEILPMNYEDEMMQMNYRTVYYLKSSNPIVEDKLIEIYPSRNRI